jgi:alkanesulfonate monooxygenase
VEAKLRAYADLGIDCFILSGYPLDDEAERVAELVLPRFDRPSR